MLTYADVCSTLRELLTPKDYLALDIGKSVSKSTSRLACFTRELEKTDATQMRLVDSILGTQFACFTGTLVHYQCKSTSTDAEKALLAGLQPGAARGADVGRRMGEACSLLLRTRLAGKSRY
jgi:hypothetical protein